MYKNLSHETFAYVLNQTSVSTIVASNKQALTILESKQKADIPNLKTIVLMADSAQQYKVGVDIPIDENLQKLADEVGIKLYQYNEIEKIGSNNKCDKSAPKSSDIFTFCYTSGSTGNPKGCLLTHKAMLTNVTAIYESYMDTDETKLIRGGEYSLSFLPLAHQMQRSVEAVMILVGGQIAYFQNDIKQLFVDIIDIRPTVFAAVPRLLNRLHDKIVNGANEAGGIKAALFNQAVDTKLYYLKQGYLKHAFWDKLVFSKIQKKLGLDRIKNIPTGSAPIAGHVLDFLRICFSCSVTEGYGQTELTCVATGTHHYHFSHSHIGGPASIAEVRLESAPELDYLVTDRKHGNLEVLGRGEICVRGPCTMEEYYAFPDKTKSTLVDGWIHTGDIGAILPNGTFKIIDRKNNIFKLSNGEYVAPEKSENISCRSSFVAQMYIHGDTFHPKLVGVVVLDPETVIPYCKANLKLDSYELENIAKSKELKDIILKDIDKTCRDAELKSFEIPKGKIYIIFIILFYIIFISFRKINNILLLILIIFIYIDIYLEHRQFTPDDSGVKMLTPTMKMQRRYGIEIYKDQLAEMLGPVA